MEAAELLSIITRLPVLSSGLAEEMLAGNFRSIFKGQGMEFDEVRHYEIGDDIRSIDWNASARFGCPFVKMYREERELTVMLLNDVSPSMHTKNAGYSPYEQALICAALIAFSTEHTGQQTGALFFDKDIEKVFPPRKSRRHLMSMITNALQFQNNIPVRKDNNGSNIKAALLGAGRMLKKRSLIILISDFFSTGWDNEMTNLCRKHDVIAIRVTDKGELPYSGLITLEDPETGIKIEAPAGMDRFKESWEQWHSERSIAWEAQCKRCGAGFLELPVKADAPSVLYKFFGSRKVR